MKQVLFVDSNPETFLRYQENLKTSHGWNYEFTTDVISAIDTLSCGNIDILIADIELPLFNEVPLLDYAKQHFPEVIRITLSGNVNTKTHAQTIDNSHRFLTKPTNPTEIEDVINHLYHLHRIIINEETRKIMGSIGTIPILPNVYKTIVKELNSADPSLRHIAQYIARDIGLSANILKVVNSAYFGLKKQITDIERAVVFLGIESLKGLIIYTSVFSSFKQTDKYPLPLDTIMNHSTTVAHIAKLESLQATTQEAIFTAGLLHNIGRLILVTSFPEKYKEVLKICQESQRCLSCIEKEIFGVSHAQIGAYLLGLWGLSDTIVESVAYHQSPADYQGSHPNTLPVLHLSNYFAHELNKTNIIRDIKVTQELDLEFLQKHAISSKYEEYQTICSDYFKNFPEYLQYV